MQSGKQACNWPSKPTARNQKKTPSSHSLRAPQCQPVQQHRYQDWPPSPSQGEPHGHKLPLRWRLSSPAWAGLGRAAPRATAAFPAMSQACYVRLETAVLLHSKKRVIWAWMFSLLSHNIQFTHHSEAKHTQFFKNHLLTVGFCWSLCQIFETKSMRLKRSFGLSSQKWNTQPFLDSVSLHSLNTTLLYSQGLHVFPLFLAWAGPHYWTDFALQDLLEEAQQINPLA